MLPRPSTSELLKQRIDRAICVAQRQQTVGQIVQRQARCPKTFCEHVENRREVVLARQAMVARDAEVGAAQFLVIFQIRRAFVFGPVTDAFRENAGQEK